MAAENHIIDNGFVDQVSHLDESSKAGQKS